MPSRVHAQGDCFAVYAISFYALFLQNPDGTGHFRYYIYYLVDEAAFDSLHLSFCLSGSFAVVHRGIWNGSVSFCSLPYCCSYLNIE